MTGQIDHQALAQGRVYAQYRDKPKFVEWMGIVGEIANEFEPVLFGISSSYDIDSATTFELDVLGVIVGVNRSFESTLGYVPTQVGRAQVGRSQLTAATGSVNQTLSNDVFRLLIRSKIVKNNGDATLDGTIEGLRFIVATDDITIDDPEDMSFSVTFGTLTTLERQVLLEFDIIQKPQGVNLFRILEAGKTQQYGKSQRGRSQRSYGLGG